MNALAPLRSVRRFALVGMAATAMLTLGSTTSREALDWLGDLCGSGDDPLFSSGSGQQNGDVTRRPASSVEVLSCEALPDVPGKSVTTAIVDFPPLGYTPAHRHPGSVSAVVLSGTIRSQLEGAAPADYTAGQTWFEPPRALHLFAANPDPVRPARLLATFVADSNCGPLVLPPDATGR